MSFDNEASNRDNDAVLDKQDTRDELAALRAEVRELRKQRALLLEARDYWMTAAHTSQAGGEC